MRVRILDHLAGLGIEPTERVLLVRGVPDHAVAIDADRVGARLRTGQREFLEGFGLGIEAADPVAAPLGEPDDAVIVDLEALRLALGGRIELRHHAVLDACDRAIVAEGGEPLLAVLADDIAVGGAEVIVLKLLGLGIEHGDGGAATRPDEPALIDPNGVRAGACAIERLVLIFGDLLGGRVEAPDAAKRELRKPDAAVDAGHRRMDAGLLGKAERK